MLQPGLLQLMRVWADSAMQRDSDSGGLGSLLFQARFRVSKMTCRVCQGRPAQQRVENRAPAVQGAGGLCCMWGLVLSKSGAQAIAVHFAWLSLPFWELRSLWGTTVSDLEALWVFLE